MNSMILTTPEETVNPRSPLVTGNDWVSLPEIRPADGSIMSANVLHMGSLGLIEWSGAGEPFMSPFVLDEDEPVHLRFEWSHLEAWIPQGRCHAKGLDISMTICAPVYEKGFVVVLEISNPIRISRRVKVGLAGKWSMTNHCIFTKKPMGVHNRIAYKPWTRCLTLEARGSTSLACLAMASEPAGRLWARHDTNTLDSPDDGELYSANGEPLEFGTECDLVLCPESSASVCIYVAANADPDGAGTTSVHLRRLGATHLLDTSLTWLASSSLTGTPGDMLEKARRNLAFCRFFAHGKAIDTEDIVALTSRSPRYYVSAAFWSRDAFLWAFPAMVRHDKVYARDLLLSTFRRHTRNVGVHAHYINGTLLYPGFELDQAASYLIALGEYLELSGDHGVLEEMVITRGVKAVIQAIQENSHHDTPLYRTFLDPSDDPVRYPYLTYDNVLVWKAYTILGRIGSALGLDEGRFADLAEGIRKAIYQHCVAEGPFGPSFVWSCDLRGNHQFYDDPPGSLVLLPYYGFTGSGDPIYLNTLAYIHSPSNPYRVGTAAFPGSGCAHSKRPWPMHACNTILSGLHLPESEHMLVNAPMDGGLACETVNEQSGLACTGLAFASFAGFLSLALARLMGAKFPCDRQSPSDGLET